MYEHHQEPLAPRRKFASRVAKSMLGAGGLLAFSLGLGVLGYHGFAGLDWVDALLDASMILTGMGPVHPMATTASKLFASAYALFSGVAFLSSMGVLAAPIAHRFLHRLHLESERGR